MKKIFFLAALTLLCVGAGCAEQPIDTGAGASVTAETQTTVDTNSGNSDSSEQAAVDSTGSGEPIIPPTPSYLPNPEELISSLHLVKGTSNGTFPYAPSDASKNVGMQIDREGGVISTMLTGGVKMYVIVPQYSVVGSAYIGILAFTSMPTTPQHPALSDAYGYGAQVVMNTVQRELKAFVVFDTTGGKAVDAIARQQKTFDRCDPSKRWFNPVICANTKKVPASTVINKEEAIVSPILSSRYAEFNTMVKIDHMIPMGIPGLLATEISHGDIFVPQKLDAGLANSLVASTMKANQDANWDAAAYITAWNLPLPETRVIENMFTVTGGDTYGAMKANVMIAPAFAATIDTRARSLAGNDADRLASAADDIRDAGQGIANDFYQEVSSDYGTTESVEGAAAVDGLASAGIPGAADAAATGSQTRDANSSKPPNQTPDADALNDIEGEIPLSDQPRATPKPKIIDVLQDRANSLLNDPNATVESLLQAAALAQQLGLDGLADKALEKVKKLLQKKIDGGADGSASGLLNAAGDAQALGLDDLANKALEKYARMGDIPCDLVHKNLGNFGINRCK